MTSPPKSPSTESDSDPEPNSLTLTVLRNAPDCEPITTVFATPPLNDAVEMHAGLRKRKVMEEDQCLRRSSTTESRHPVKGKSLSPPKMLMSLANDDLGVALSNDSNFHSDAKTGHLSICKETKPFNSSHGKFFGVKQLRKSPRLNPSSEAYAVKLDVKLNSAMQLRRSPRLSSPNGNENMQIVVHQKKKNTKVISTFIELANSPVEQHSEVKTIIGGMQLRKSPRLNVSSEPYAEKLDVKLCSAMELRRSPRLSSSNGNMEIIVHQKKKNTKVISTSVELSNSPLEQHSEVKAISRSSTCGIDDTKYLRWSSEAITSSSWVENGRTASDSFALPELDDNPPRKKHKTSTSSTKDCMDSESIPCFIGDPIPDDEAQKRWGWRYELKDKKCKGQKFKINEGEEDEIIANVKCHYAQAEIGNCIFSLGDCAFIKGEGEHNHVGKIIEFFQTTNGQDYFRVQWFYRIQDTVVQDDGGFHDKRRLFYSSIMNDNSLDCIIGKANVTQITPRV